METIELTESQKLQLIDEGFCLIPGAIPEHLVSSAAELVRTLSTKAAGPDQRDAFVNEHGRSDEATLKLFNDSSVASIVTSLVGDIVPVTGAHIVLRDPEYLTQKSDNGEVHPTPAWMSGFVLDGFRPGRNAGEIENYTLLVYVFLEDCSQEFSGNYVVYPRSHHLLERHFVREGLTNVETLGFQAIPKTELPFAAPKQIVGKRGDVLITHYQLAHGSSPNVSRDRINTAAYFRVHAAAHPRGTYRPDAMKDIWLDWQPIRALALERKTMKEVYDPAPADVEYMCVKKDAEAAYTEREWVKGRPFWQRMITLRDNDPLTLVKAGVCCTYPTKEVSREVVLAGESYLRRALYFVPNSLAAWAVLARNFHTQGRYPDVRGCFEALMNCFVPKTDTWHSPVVDCVRVTLDAATKLKQEAENSAILARASFKFPAISADLGKLVGAGEAARLWVIGKKMMAEKKKNWVAAQPIFGRLAQLQPEGYWSQCYAAMCFTYSKTNYLFGEIYANAAIAIERGNACGYGILARNLMHQGKIQHVPTVFEAMLKDVDDADAVKHPNLAVDCLRAVYESLSFLSRGDEKPVYLKRFCERYPSIAEKAVAMKVGGSNDCVIM